MVAFIGGHLRTRSSFARVSTFVKPALVQTPWDGPQVVQTIPAIQNSFYAFFALSAVQSNRRSSTARNAKSAKPSVSADGADGRR